MAKYISEDSERQICRLLEICKQEKSDITFTICDTEGIVAKTVESNKVIEEIDGGDEDIGINCYNKNGFLGWFGILPYEDEDIIYDHSDNAFCNNVMRRI